MTISNETRGRVKRVFEPIALAMGRAGLTPDGLTIIGFAITVVGAALLIAQLWLVGGLVVFFGGVFDMFDGTLARATGKVSRLGAFMDSVFDRWGEAIVYLGIVIGTSASAWAWAMPWDETATIRVLPSLAAFALGSAFMVSYARAKSEGLGFTEGTGMAAVGLMPREIRLVILSAGLLVTGLAGGVPTSIDQGPRVDDGSGWLALALAVIGVGATITVVQRIVHVRRQAAQQASATSTQQSTTPPTQQ
jgi:CDP-diacylglycerol--glycerol-3-phosphate 3-phosphatidyltransferase